VPWVIRAWGESRSFCFCCSFSPSARAETMKVHLADPDRPTKLQCGIDRVGPRDARPTTESLKLCTCRSCFNLRFVGRIGWRRGGDWIRQ
jgi:hypothetical protein